MRKLLQFFDKSLLQIFVWFLILFIPLYPKLPSIHINHTWVYIRLEDFFIATAFFIYFFELLRKKVKIPVIVSIPFGLYWFSALCSLLVSIFIIGPTIALFYPSVAALEFLRRIEYMALFFIAFSTIKAKNDIVKFLYGLFIAIFGIVFYGIGQRTYLIFWNKFPYFFEKYPFCFPSFQTGNEEFAKGIPLCLPSDARITSTFGGHYDLAAYLVFFIPLLVASLFIFKKWYARLGIFLL